MLISFTVYCYFMHLNLILPDLIKINYNIEIKFGFVTLIACAIQVGYRTYILDLSY